MAARAVVLVAASALLMLAATIAAATPMPTLREAVQTLPPPSPVPPRLAAKHADAKRKTLELLLVGRKSKGGGGDKGDTTADCEAEGYRNRVMGLLHEANFLGLFRDLKNQTKLEASGMDVLGDDLFVVFDNTPLVGMVDLHFAYEDPHNALIPPVVGSVGGAEAAAAGRDQRLLRGLPRRRLQGQSDSQFEGISAIPSRPGEFMIIEEMREVASSNRRGDDDGDEPGVVFHPFAQRVALSRRSPDGYRVLERCAVHLVLTRENKGVEGIEYIEDTRGKGYLLAACEGNWCEGGRKGRDRGNGKIAVLEFVPATKQEPCSWQVVKTLDIPPAAAFLDYSDLAFADPGFRGEDRSQGKGAVAVLSQEDAALWVGQFDYNKMEFDPEVAGAAFVLPKDGMCRSIWCNAEGLAWLDKTRLAVATDRAKASQSYVCTSKDEALGTFALPDGADEAIYGKREGEEVKVRVEVV